ncbi:hypothetical protein SAMN04515647_4272 [Cohaesibacter sp. ES.047]|nr:hypothetical protein [Cohaesibacter sp. ES.047]SNY93950.1 hypothetical protein SAMN04515647_4272 [Cohaesibacter sp. ES.047]
MTFSSFFKTLSMLVCGFVAMALVAMPANAATIDLSPAVRSGW